MRISYSFWKKMDSRGGKEEHEERERERKPKREKTGIEKDQPNKPSQDE